MGRSLIDPLPLARFRLLFGLVVLYGGLVSALKGDVQSRFLEPAFFFKYYGMEWLRLPSPVWVYAAYTAWIAGAAGIALGLLYRASLLVFLLGFTYLHFLDSANYINHYYLISLLGCMLLGVPQAAGAWSADERLGWARTGGISSNVLLAFRLQIALVYIYAGLAKLNPDWLLRAMPLRVWLLQAQDFPLLGDLFVLPATAYVFSWFAAFYDLTIVFWLLLPKTRPWAYGAVVAFHGLTGLLFDIGLFPPLMMAASTLFLPARSLDAPPPTPRYGLRRLFALYFVWQLLMPIRHLFLYPGRNILWTEEGYRFGWRVMLYEKDGWATFYVRDPQTGREWEVDNSDWLTPFQIKQMSAKPEHIRQYAHRLAEVYGRLYQIENPEVRADVFVTLNGRPGRRLVRPDVNLAAQPSSFWSCQWILPFE